MNVDQPKHGRNFLNTFFGKLNVTVRGHVVAVLGEFAGTFFFLFLAFSGVQSAQVSTNSNAGSNLSTKTPSKTTSELLYISLAFGFSLTATVWVYFRISGGLFNPAVSFGMFLIGAITWIRAVLLFVTQLVAAIIASYVVKALFPGGLNVNTSLAATTTLAEGVIIEMLLTAQLVFTIFMLAAEKHTGNFIAPVGIGLSFFVAELSAVFWTGGSLNPARSLGPAVATHFQPYHWIYWVGPLAGSCLAALLLKLIKTLEYENANADPEAKGSEASTPEHQQTA